MPRRAALVVTLALACQPRPAPPPAAAPPAAAAAPPGDGPAALLALAEAALDADQAAAAAAAAAALVARQPHSAPGQLVWARALGRQGDVAGSIPHYEAARAAAAAAGEPLPAAVDAELAAAYDVTHQYGRAAATYGAYLAAHPDDVEMRHELGLTLLLGGDPAAAAEQLQRALAAAPPPPPPPLLGDLGLALLRAGQPQAALPPLRAAADAEPRLTVARQALAEALAAAGELPAAAAVLDALLTETPGLRQARLLRGRLRLASDAFAAALADYDVVRAAAAAGDTDADAELGAAGALVGLQRLAEAEAALTRCRAAAGTTPLWQFRRAQLDWRRGDVGSLVRLRALAAGRPPDDPRWAELRAATEALAPPQRPARRR